MPMADVPASGIMISRTAPFIALHVPNASAKFGCPSMSTTNAGVTVNAPPTICKNNSVGDATAIYFKSIP